MTQHKLPPGTTVTWLARHPLERSSRTTSGGSGRVGTWCVQAPGHAPAYTHTEAAGVALAYAMYTTARTGVKVKRASSTRVEFKGRVCAPGHWQGRVS